MRARWFQGSLPLVLTELPVRHPVLPTGSVQAREHKSQKKPFEGVSVCPGHAWTSSDITGNAAE